MVGLAVAFGEDEPTPPVGTLGDARALFARDRDGGLCAFLVQGGSIGGGCRESGAPGHQPSYMGVPAGERVALLIPVPDHVAIVQVDDRTLTLERNAVLTPVPRDEERLRFVGEGDRTSFPLDYRDSP